MQRALPSVLWISLITLGLISVIQFALAIAQMNIALLIGVVFNILILFGLYYGHRWAFVVTLILGILGVLVMLGRGPAAALGVLIGNGLVLVPMLLAKDYFWAARTQRTVFAANYCHRCGCNLADVVQKHCPDCGAEIRAADSRATG